LRRDIVKYGVFVLALCLAAPVRPEAKDDPPVGLNTPAFEAERAQDEDGDGPTRKSARRKARKAARGGFDPKVFEARGRELKGELYVVSSITSAPTWSIEGIDMESTVAEPVSERNWLLWGGAAGLTVLVAGAAGWLLLDDPGQAAPVSVHVSDQP
jgi:hypothetical protein